MCVTVRRSDGDVMAGTRDLRVQQLDLSVLMLSYFWMGFKCVFAIRNLTTGQLKKSFRLYLNVASFVCFPHDTLFYTINIIKAYLK